MQQAAPGDSRVGSMGSGSIGTKNKGRVVWRISKVVDLAGRERCSRQYVRSARKNAKYLSSQEKTVRYIARIVSQSVKIAVVN